MPVKAQAFSHFNIKGGVFWIKISLAPKSVSRNLSLIIRTDICMFMNANQSYCPASVPVDTAQSKKGGKREKKLMQQLR